MDPARISPVSSGKGCGGWLAHAILMVTMAILALVCFAGRGWIEDKIVSEVYGQRPKIHAGKHFEPGATAVEDGERQTALLIGGKPHVKVTSPPREWLDKHRDARCKRDVCTARATPARFLGANGFSLTALLAALMVCYITWVLIIGDDPPPRR